MSRANPSLRLSSPELARILTGFFIRSFAFGFAPNVEPLLDRLQFAGFKQVQLFHFGRLLCFVWMAVSVFFLRFSVQESTGMNHSVTIR